MVLEEDINRVISDDNIQWNKLRDNTVIVTGATGLIGSLCIKSMLALGFPVKIYAFVRDIEKAKKQFGEQIDYIVGDIRKPIISSAAPDYIIHCASNTQSKLMVDEPVDTLDISITGTMNVLRFAVEKKVKSIVYLSSMEAYGVTQESQNPITEEKLGYIDLKSARSSYSEGKRASECLCSAFFHQYNLPVKIARLALTMGPGVSLTDNRVSMQFAKSAAYGKDIVLHTEGKSISNFCYTSDCIRGIFTVLLNGKNGEIYNICNDKETRSIREIADLVANNIAHGSIKVVCDIPCENQYGYAPDAVLRLSSEKLMRIGWIPQINMINAYNRLVDYITEE